ncbi:hypothetical protein GA0115234_10584 [Streptomyces sp. DvalAA-43]|nr:hypothetical protein GA0115234_10584 [Streptomyces sp. DvalAA-43]
MDAIDHEWEELDLKQMIDDYEEMDQAEYAEFMGDLLDD